MQRVKVKTNGNTGPYLVPYWSYLVPYWSYLVPYWSYLVPYWSYLVPCRGGVQGQLSVPTPHSPTSHSRSVEHYLERERERERGEVSLRTIIRVSVVT